MKISTRGRYGIRLLLDMAAQGKDSPVTLASIAERQNISIPYLEQVAVILRRAGYIRSVKGAAGGYILLRTPAEIGIGEVLHALEGDLSVVDPPLPGEKETPLQRCLRAAVYNKLDSTIYETLNSLTLETMLCGDGENESAYMYFI